MEASHDFMTEFARKCRILSMNPSMLIISNMDIISCQMLPLYDDAFKLIIMKFEKKYQSEAVTINLNE